MDLGLASRPTPSCPPPSLAPGGGSRDPCPGKGKSETYVCSHCIFRVHLGYANIKLLHYVKAQTQHGGGWRIVDLYRRDSACEISILLGTDVLTLQRARLLDCVEAELRMFFLRMCNTCCYLGMQNGRHMWGFPVMSGRVRVR